MTLKTSIIEDKPNGILITHNADWSGIVRIAWYMVDGQRSALQECWCVGRDLIAGRFTPVSAPNKPEHGRGSLTATPINILTRAVTLAVETYLRSRLQAFVDTLYTIDRGKL